MIKNIKNKLRELIIKTFSLRSILNIVGVSLIAITLRHFFVSCGFDPLILPVSFEGFSYFFIVGCLKQLICSIEIDSCKIPMGIYTSSSSSFGSSSSSSSDVFFSNASNSTLVGESSSNTGVGSSQSNSSNQGNQTNHNNNITPGDERIIYTYGFATPEQVAFRDHVVANGYDPSMSHQPYAKQLAAQLARGRASEGHSVIPAGIADGDAKYIEVMALQYRPDFNTNRHYYNTNNFRRYLRRLP